MTSPRTFNEAIHQLADDIANLVISKQLDYGTNNILEFGEYGILIRISDKRHRLKNLLSKERLPSNESIDDTWRDIAGYALVAMMLRRHWFTLPIEGDEK